ncbi:putative tail protein [Dickeya phage Sucellus]|nr:putative tail protein [Dickeya phage Sucellus]
MGKGSGSSTHTPVEQPDTLKNKQLYKVLDLISEGPCKGFANQTNPLNSVFLAGTSVVNSAGETNINGVTMAYNLGTPDQDYISGFSDNSSGEVSVSVEVKKDQPVVRTINTAVDRIKLTVGGSALYSYETNGDKNRASMSMRFEIVKDGASYTANRLDVIDQKSSSEYLLSVELNSLPKPPFDVRVVRETEDSTSSNLINDSFWRSYTEIIDVKQSFPYCAVVGIAIDSEGFGSNPKRNYLWDGLYVQVPDNYDAESATYNGFWSGEFKIAWTQNPVWIYLDLLTNERYGLGKYISMDMVDIYKLYEVAQYCDELVDSGYGNYKERRFMCNAYITDQEYAYDVIDKFASVFNSMQINNGTQMSLSSDIPGDIKQQFTNSNIVGSFVYNSTELSDRHSVVQVEYSNAENNYEKEYIVIPDDELILRFGWSVKKVTAFATTSKGQAWRAGKYILESEKQNTMAVNFRTGTNGLRSLPGDLIEIADNEFATSTVGGRIKYVSEDKKTFALDRMIGFTNGDDVYLGFMDGREFKKEKIISVDETDSIVTLGAAAESIYEGSVFSISRVSVQPRVFRIVNIDIDFNKMEYIISAISHSSRKYSDVDNSTYFSGTLPSNEGMTTLPSIVNLSVRYNNDNSSPSVEATWQCPTAGSNISYMVKVVRAGLIVESVVVDKTSYSIRITDQGEYSIQVRCISTETGLMGPISKVIFVVAAPSPPVSLRFENGFFAQTCIPVESSNNIIMTDYQFFISPDELDFSTTGDVLAEAEQLGYGQSWTKSGLQVGQRYYWYVRSYNQFGFSEFISDSAVLEVPIDELIDQIERDLFESDAFKVLENGVKEQTKASIDNALSVYQNNMSDVESEIYFRKENDGRVADYKHSVYLINTESEVRAAEITQLNSKINDEIESKITIINETIATLESATSNRFVSLESKINDPSTGLQANATAIDNLSTNVNIIDGKLTAQASRVELLEANAGETSASIEEIKTVQATTDGKFNALYTMRIETSGAEKYVAGMQLGANNAGSFATFLVDQFSVASNVGGAKQLVFTTLNGQMIIRNALIGDGTIDTAKIKDAAITNAKIAGNLSSDNWDGNMGWSLNKSGGFEMVAVGLGRVRLDGTGLAIYTLSGALISKLGWQ